jgi:membrane protein
MFKTAWVLLKNTVSGFLEDSALSRGASIAYFTIFSMAPLLIVVTAVAGLVFGYEAAQTAMVAQFSGLMGQQTAETLRGMIEKASVTDTGTWATLLGVGTLLLTASGAFGEIQSTLNAIWKAEPRAGLSRLVRARLVGLGLVLTLGFLLLVSLVVSAGLAALGSWIDTLLPAGKVVLMILNTVLSVILLAIVFGAIFKLLPDQEIAWPDVAIGAVATAVLFTIGKSAIGVYIGRSQIGSGFGAAGALIVLLVWIYYSSLIFLLGAEFTRAYAQLHGSHIATAASIAVASAPAALPPAERLPSGIRVAKVDIARGAMCETNAITARVPDPLPDKIGSHPSLLQIAVAMLAVLILSPARRADRDSASPGSRKKPVHEDRL